MRDASNPRKYIRVIGRKAFVELTKGKTAIIDAADVPLVDHCLWQAKLHEGIWYAVDRRKRFMHRRILELEPSLPVVDHIDGDGLNNIRANLRLCTSKQNIRNSKKYTVAGKKPRSQFKGVTRVKGRDGWRAQISRDGIKINLGSYETEEMAARVYDMAAREYFGEFARTNFTEEAA